MHHLAVLWNCGSNPPAWGKHGKKKPCQSHDVTRFTAAVKALQFLHAACSAGTHVA
jgi:hypothetical protein